MSKEMLILEVRCPQCGALLTKNKRIHLNGYIRDTQKDGAILLSALFGDYTVETDLDIPEGSITDFRCPQCDNPIAISSTCKLCYAPMASLNIASGGYLEFCTRKGCKGHALGGFGDIDQMMSLMNKMFNTPHD